MLRCRPPRCFGVDCLDVGCFKVACFNVASMLIASMLVAPRCWSRLNVGLLDLRVGRFDAFAMRVHRAAGSTVCKSLYPESAGWSSGCKGQSHAARCCFGRMVSCLLALVCPTNNPSQIRSLELSRSLFCSISAIRQASAPKESTRSTAIPLAYWKNFSSEFSFALFSKSRS